MPISGSHKREPRIRSAVFYKLLLDSDLQRKQLTSKKLSLIPSLMSFDQFWYVLTI